LLDDAANDHERIMVPSLVLSEFLVEYTPDERVEVLAQARLRFFIADFNFRAAAIAATLYADKEARNAARDVHGSTKQCIKVDISILATAEAHRPTVFYAEDGPLLELAKRMKKYLTIDVRQLPPVRDKQPELPGLGQ